MTDRIKIYKSNYKGENGEQIWKCSLVIQSSQIVIIDYFRVLSKCTFWFKAYLKEKNQRMLYIYQH